jgi:hypothetical protein
MMTGTPGSLPDIISLGVNKRSGARSLEDVYTAEDGRFRVHIEEAGE